MSDIPIDPTPTPPATPDDEKSGCGSLIVKGLIAAVILAGLLLGTCALLVSR